MMQGKSGNPFPLRENDKIHGCTRVAIGHDCREKVRPGTGREAGLGHAGDSAVQEQLPKMLDAIRMRGYIESGSSLI